MRTGVAPLWPGEGGHWVRLAGVGEGVELVAPVSGQDP